VDEQEKTGVAAVVEADLVADVRANPEIYGLPQDMPSAERFGALIRAGARALAAATAAANGAPMGGSDVATTEDVPVIPTTVDGTAIVDDAPMDGFASIGGFAPFEDPGPAPLAPRPPASPLGRRPAAPPSRPPGPVVRAVVWPTLRRP
jgi:hypothetical protein